MVYCGKPSTACTECRTRRTRCNKARPSCSQCIRAGRNCSGYRDLLSLMFRDENVKLRKRSGSGESTGYTYPEVLRAPPTMFYESRDSPPVDSISPSLLISIEEQATCYFFQNYVFEDQDPSTKSPFDYLPSLFRDLPPKSVLSQAVIAVGLAGIASTRKASQVMTTAQLRYTVTVRAISAVIADIEQAKQDQVLVAVLLLGFYEESASDTPRSVRSWSQHIKGAESIVRLRGKDQVQTYVGRRLFFQIRSQIITNCLQRRIRVPEEIHDWSRSVSQLDTAEEACTTRMFEAAILLCNLRATMTELYDYHNSASVASQALEIDSMFQDWEDKVPLKYLYRTVLVTEETDEVFSDHYHVYADVWSAAAWNSYRTLRIILNEILIVQLVHLCETNLAIDDDDEDLDLLVSYRKQISASRSLIEQLARDVCASVPFYFGYHKKELHKLWVRPPVPAVSGMLLLWRLYSCAVAGRSSDSMLAWIVGRLNELSEVTGVRHASALAKVLSQRKQIAVWDSSAMDLMAETAEEAEEWGLSTQDMDPPHEDNIWLEQDGI